MLIEPCGPLDFFPDLRFETTGLLLKGQRKGVGEIEETVSRPLIFFPFSQLGFVQNSQFHCP